MAEQAAPGQAAIAVITPAEARLGIALLGRFLIGQRAAIETVARQRWAMLGIAFLFVLSAGFAREYDGEDLLAAPWYVVVPLAVSLPMALVLWMVLYVFAQFCGVRGLRYGAGAVAFVTCYWMTAPLAWLYAVPYERMFDATEATRWNLWTLSLVALWRVLLIWRVSAVLLGCRMWLTAGPVFLFACAATLIAIAVSPHPPVAIMGGIRLTEAEQLVAMATLNAQIFSMLGVPIFSVLTLVIAAASTRDSHALGLDGPRARRGWALPLVAVATVVVWAAVLPVTQPEQQLRERVESAFRAGEIDAALDILSAHQRDDFPPHWHPPPRPWEKGEGPSFLTVVEHVATRPVAAWVRAAYVESVRDLFAERFEIMEKLDDQWPPIANVLEKLPEGAGLAREMHAMFDLSDVIVSRPRSSAATDALRRIARLAGVSVPEATSLPSGE